ncbi:MAG: TetR/AcrR family transcriptional regulator [Sandaracinaceae bacterium]
MNRDAPHPQTLRAHEANRERGERTRASIRDAAIRVACEVGPARCSLSRVARAAGVSNGTIHYHFGSIGDVLIDVIRARDVDLTEPLRTLREVGGLEGLATLSVVGEYAAAKPDSARLHALLLAEAIDPEHFAHRWFSRRKRVLFAMFEEAIHKGQTRGEIRADVDGARVASSILAFMDGITLQLAHDPSIDIVAEYDAHFGLLADALASRAARRCPEG